MVKRYFVLRRQILRQDKPNRLRDITMNVEVRPHVIRPKINTVNLRLVDSLLDEIDADFDISTHTDCAAKLAVNLRPMGCCRFHDTLTILKTVKRNLLSFGKIPKVFALCKVNEIEFFRFPLLEPAKFGTAVTPGNPFAIKTEIGDLCIALRT